MKLKETFFGTPKRVVLTILCIVLVLAAVSIGVGAATVSQNVIGRTAAQAVALADAGLNRSDVDALRTELEFDDGILQYDVTFFSGGITYEYMIRASDGVVLEREIEGGSGKKPMPESGPTGSSQNPQPGTDATGGITLDEAKAAALRDANLQAQDVTFTKAKRDYDDGIAVYELEFILNSGGVIYDYEISAADGSVREQKAEIVLDDGIVSGRETEGGAGTDSEPNAGGITLDEAKAAALRDANLQAQDVTFTKEKSDFDNGVAVYELEFISGGIEYDYEISASDGAVREKSSERIQVQMTPPSVTPAVTPNPPSGAGTDSEPNAGGITLEDAKAAALRDANLQAQDVTFTKEKSDIDDGVAVYELEFISGGIEYDYEISAADGSVREKSSEKLQEQRTPQAVTPASPPSGAGTDSEPKAGGITLDEAKAAALRDANLQAQDVVFTKEKSDIDDGVAVYELEFISGGIEYDYEISAADGSVREKSSERIQVQMTPPSVTPAVGGDGTPYITADEAQAVALKHANFSAADVRFSKTELDRDDGKMTYELEFYHDGLEYSYTVDAVSGEILEFETDKD